MRRCLPLSALDRGMHLRQVFPQLPIHFLFLSLSLLSRCEQLGRSRIAPRIRQPLPRLYAPYTDNRENVQSRSYRNLDLFIGDDYSRPYTDAEHAPTVRRDLSTKTTTTSRSSSSSATTASPSAVPPRSPQRSTATPWSSTQRLNATTAVSVQSTSRSQGAA